MTSAPTVGSLFTGIGGIDLGLERAGFDIAWQCELDPYCRRVLARHWPGLPCYEDVRELPDDVERTDVVAGGYPCQPFSLAGGRQGDSDPRHLWPYFFGVLRRLRPGHALLENVPGHLSLGWDGVLADLASIGYDVEWTCIPAAAFGAPHLRWRLFAVAHATSDAGWLGDRDGAPHVPHAELDRLRVQPVAQRRCSGPTVFADNGPGWDVADAADNGSRRWRQQPQRGQSPRDVADAESLGPQGQPAQPRGRARSADGGRWESEPGLGRVADGIPDRMDRLRCLGNAVVPQVAEWVGQQLMAHLVSIEPGTRPAHVGGEPISATVRSAASPAGWSP
jgi:DNA (cytosine-5)-methyltransferase 1